MGPVTREAPAQPHGAAYEELAALAARTGGEPVGGKGFAWSGDAALALTLTEHGTPTTVADIERMSPPERARANLAAAEAKLYQARTRLARLKGPDPDPLPFLTLAEDIAQTTMAVAHREREQQERREELDRIQSFPNAYFPPPEVGSCPGKPDIQHSSWTRRGHPLSIYPCCNGGVRVDVEVESGHSTVLPASHEVSNTLVATEGRSRRGKTLHVAPPGLPLTDDRCISQISPVAETEATVTLLDIPPYVEWCWHGTGYHRARRSGNRTPWFSA